MVHTSLAREMSSSMERIHVQDVYDQIAPHFADIEQKAWPKVKNFLKCLEPGSLVADIGCGNGRYLKINNGIYKIGLDVCHTLISHARQQGHEVMTADNLHLPFRDGFFDAVISIGVIHHFSSQARRIQALKELSRVLSPGGKLMVYVWAFEQKHRRFESQDVLVPWHKPSHPSPRLLRGSCSDIDHSSTSSVSDDETSSASSLTRDNSPEEAAPFSHRIQSLDDVNIYDDVFETENENTVKLSHKGPLDQQTLVEECRRLEACLKELSEKQVSSAQSDSPGGSASGKYNFRKKSIADVVMSNATASIHSNGMKSANQKDKKKVPFELPSASSFSGKKFPVPNTHHHPNCPSLMANHSSEKPGIFQKLKQSFQDLVTPISKKKDTKNNGPLHQPVYPMFMPDDPSLFAVREFPQSSLPCPVDDPPALELKPSGVLPKMKRNVSAGSEDLSQVRCNGGEKFTRSRSGSVKSLPLELSDDNSATHSSKSSQGWIGSSVSSGSLTLPKLNGKASTETYKHSRNQQIGHWRSQGEIYQSKLSTKKSVRKGATCSTDLAKLACQNMDNNDFEFHGGSVNGGSRIGKRNVESVSDGFSSPQCAVTESNTPANADLCRFYHVFRQGELVDLVKDNIEDLHIIDTYFDHANWCLIAEKVRMWKI